MIFAYPMEAGPLALKLSERLLNDLNVKQPELVVAANLKMSLTPTMVESNLSPVLANE